MPDKITALAQDKKLVLFDFDGTLVDSFDALIESFNDAAEKYSCKLIASEQHYYVRNLGGTMELLREFGVSWYKLPFVIQHVRSVFKNKITSLEPIAGIVEVLHTLRELGYCLGIVTSNSVENVMLFLKKHSIDDLFDCVCSESGMFNKHVVFKRLSDELHISSGAMVYVGDGVRDIHAARKAGVKIIAVAWGHDSKEILRKHEPDVLIETPSELIDKI